ncbi:MAG: TonB-dependent receptor plug domain-containing protein [Gemmatimonadota bacterium]
MNIRRAIYTAAALALALTLARPAAAQETGTIRGTVTVAGVDRPLNGAQVFVEGTGLGTLTNEDGVFLLPSVPVGEVTVQVEMLGYSAAERTVVVRSGETVAVDFELDRSAIQLEEVVVTGRGRQVERRQLGTTVDVMDEADIELAPVTSVDELLQGRVAGASIQSVSAQPGTGSQINFRGITSVISNQTPVIYIDGVRVDNETMASAGTGGEFSSALSELLVSEIERIEITKGGAASTLYGSDAANGVIQIFTKKGAPSEPRVSVGVEQGFDTPELKYILDSQVIWESQVENDSSLRDFLRNNFFETGHFQKYTVRVAGGTSDFTYHVGGRLQDGTGVQPKNESTLYSLRGGIQAQVGDPLRLDFNGSYVRSDFGRLFNGTAIADPLTTFEVGDALLFSGESTLHGALDMFLRPDVTEEVDRFIFGASATLSPSDLFTTRLSLGIDNRGNQQRIFEPIGFTPGNEEGFLNRYQRTFTSVTLDYSGTVSYEPSSDVTSEFTFGAQGFREDESIVDADGLGFGLPGAPEFDEAASIDASELNREIFNGGFYFEETLGLFDRAFATGGVRLDYNSAFGEEVGFRAYPKFETAYMLSDEDFWRDALGSVADQFKLRAAYGQTGKFPLPYLRDRTFSATSFRGESAPQFDNPGNQELGPEVTTTLEVGVDAAFLDDRIGLNVTYYDAATDDALLFVPEQPSTGQGTQLRNVGRIANTGWELSGNATLLARRDLLWTLGAQFSTVDNVVEDMGGAAPFFVEPQKRVAEGRPVGAWYVTTPVDTNDDGLPDDSELRFTGGQPTPTHNGNVSTSVTLFDRITLSGLADWATGHEVMDFGSVWATFNGIYRREIREEGYTFPVVHDENGDPVVNDDGDPVKFGQSNARSEFIYDGDYIKLREIGLTYELPQAWLLNFGAERATLRATVRNVAIWSRNPLIDPSLSGLASSGLSLGSESSITLSPPRQFRLGIDVTF